MQMNLRNMATALMPAQQIRKFAVALLAALALTLAISSEAFAAPSKWETLKSERTELKTVAKDSEVEIRAAKGVITISSSKPVSVKVYTILGQLISKENLPAGISQLSVQAHGVYIIRIGDLTCKVAL